MPPRAITAYVYYDIAFGLLNVYAYADSRCHRLVHQIHIARINSLRRVVNGAFFHFRNSGWYAHHNFQRRRENAFLYSRYVLYQLVYHEFRRLEVSYHAILQGPYGLYVLVRFSLHERGVASHGYDLTRALVYGHNRRAVHHHFVIVYDKCVGRAQVYGYFLGEKIEYAHLFTGMFLYR